MAHNSQRRQIAKNERSVSSKDVTIEGNGPLLASTASSVTGHDEPFWSAKLRSIRSRAPVLLPMPQRLGLTQTAFCEANSQSTVISRADVVRADGDKLEFFSVSTMRADAPEFIPFLETAEATPDSTVSNESGMSDAESELSSTSASSVEQVRVGTHPYLDSRGILYTKGSDVMKLTDYMNLPVDDNGVKLTAASARHLNIKPNTKGPKRWISCRRCIWYNAFAIRKQRLCKHGALCDFCHGQHDRFIHFQR